MPDQTHEFLVNEKAEALIAKFVRDVCEWTPAEQRKVDPAEIINMTRNDLVELLRDFVRESAS